MIKIIRAKLHGIRVTDADLNYHGSITLDPEHCAKIGIYPLEFVEIWNKNNGARISTYVIFGEAGSKCCVLNGSAARSCEVGDELIIAASSYVKPDELYTIKPRFLTFHPNNDIDQVMAYNVFKNDAFDFNFEMVENADK
ncbi:MAG: aspartate 1-decarboxylase [Alphaproteobacteria bacterium]